MYQIQWMPSMHLKLLLDLFKCRHCSSFCPPHMPVKGSWLRKPFHLPVYCLNSASDCSSEMFWRVYFSWMKKAFFSALSEVTFFNQKDRETVPHTCPCPSRQITHFSLGITTYFFLLVEKWINTTALSGEFINVGGERFDVVWDEQQV